MARPGKKSEPADPLAIPAFLMMDAVARRAAWDAKGPPQTVQPQVVGRLSSAEGPAMEAFRAEKKTKDQNRIAKMKLRFSTKRALSEGRRWDTRTARWITDEPQPPHEGTEKETEMDTTATPKAKKAPKAKAAKATKPAKAAKAKKAPSEGRNMKMHGATIKILKNENPGRKDSRRAAAFDALKEGMTVGEFISVMNKSKHAADNYNPVGTLRFFEKEKLIKLNPAPAAA